MAHTAARARLQPPQARTCAQGSWPQLPTDVLASVLALLPTHDRVAAIATCKAWRHTAAERPDLWTSLTFATHRAGSRRSELRRLLSLAAFCSRYAACTRSLSIAARVPPDAQPAALKAVAQAALAAAGSLRALTIVTNRGHWPAWLPRLNQLRSLHLSSKEGGLSLTGDLTPLSQLAHLRLDARHAVTLADTVRLPPSIHTCELGCIRDTLPSQLSQLRGLRALSVRRMLVSEGVLLTEHECLTALIGLTSLELQGAEEEAWLLPPEILGLTRLVHLSIAGCDCSRWPLHGSDEEFNRALARMPHLTSLDLSGCCLEELPAALPGGGDEADEAALRGGSSNSGGGGSVGPSCGLLRLLAHGNQLEGGDGEDEPLALPSSARQLSLDIHLLLHLPALRLPPGCRQLALVGEERGAAQQVASALPALQQLLPDLRHLLLEPATIAALERLGTAGTAPALQQVAGRWRPTRLPGQPRMRGQDPLQQFRAAGIQILELPDQPRLLAPLLDRLAAAPAAALPC